MDASQSRRAQREVERLKKRRVREFIAALRWVMKDPRGRRVLSWVIHELCRRDATTTGGSLEATSYHSAVRDVAVKISETLDLWCPEERVTMEVEALRRNHARRNDADHVRRVAEDDGADDA